MKIAVIGYGRLGKSVVKAVKSDKETTLSAVLTHRDPALLFASEGLPFFAFSQAESVLRDCDIALICTSSERDTPFVTPYIALYCDAVDCYDNHSQMQKHVRAVQENAKQTGHLAVLGAGWDPGLLSVMRLYASASLPHGATYTFWGPGVSQGHSEILRRVLNTDKAVQITVPEKDAYRMARKGYILPLTAREMHRRVCYTCTEISGEQKKRVQAVPDYFEGYRTVFKTVSEEELKEKTDNPHHSGTVIRVGKTGRTRHTFTACIKTESNPDLTAQIMLCYAKALKRMKQNNTLGAVTPLQIAPQYLVEKQEIEQYL